MKQIQAYPREAFITTWIHLAPVFPILSGHAQTYLYSRAYRLQLIPPRVDTSGAYSLGLLRWFMIHGPYAKIDL